MNPRVSIIRHTQRLGCVGCSPVIVAPERRGTSSGAAHSGAALEAILLLLSRVDRGSQCAGEVSAGVNSRPMNRTYSFAGLFMTHELAVSSSGTVNELVSVPVY